MMRESLQSNSPYTLIERAAHWGVNVQQRSSPGAATELNPAGTVSGLHIYSLHNWFRISRVGNTFTSACSRDGINWVTISQQTLALSNSLHVGMFVSGANGTYASKAIFSNVAITTANPSPTVNITAPLQNTSVTTGSLLTISANAADANGSVSRVDFYYGSTLIGSDETAPYTISWNVPGGGRYYLTAKAVDNQGAITTSIPVLIIVPCTFTNAKITGTVIGTPGSWAGQGNTRDKAFDEDVTSFFDASEDVAWTGLALAKDYRVTGINFYPREQFSGRMMGGRFEGSNTADFTSGVVVLATIDVEPLYEWNCVTITNTSAFRYIRYICAPGGVGNVAEIEFYGVEVVPNVAPTVSVNSPANGATFTAPASITLTAVAADADGTVSKVEFFNGATKLGEDLTSPYSYSWTGVAAGTYTITAKATDNVLASTTSSAISVVVNTPTAQSPFNGTPWPIPGTVEAENYDLGGQGVAFNELTAGNSGNAYRTDAVDIEGASEGGHNIGWVQAGEWLEYTVNVTAGTYTIDARVAAVTTGRTFQLQLDGTTIGNFTIPNTGGWQAWQTVSITGINLSAGLKVLRMNATTSEFNLNRLVFTRTNVNVAPTVNISSPSNGTTYVAPASIQINANAADADGTVSKVEFFNGSTKLGEDLSNPYSFNWSGVVAGSYTISVRATDNQGAITNSSTVSITVNPASTQTPYGGTAWVIPGTIEAENYDVGGQNIAFNELSAGNSGNVYRFDAVDIEACSEGGFNVGWVQNGEWLEYTVNVTQAGVYSLQARVASNTSTGSVQFEMNGLNITGVLSVPFTGGWQNWQSIAQTGFSLTAGVHVLRMKMTGNDFNVNRIEFIRSGGSARSLDVMAELQPSASVFPNPLGESGLLYLGSENTVSVKILNASGVVVFEKQHWNSENPLDLNALTQGIYQVVINNGGTLETSKLVR
jgi:hypothetical protein